MAWDTHYPDFTYIHRYYQQWGHNSVLKQVKMPHSAQEVDKARTLPNKWALPRVGDCSANPAVLSLHPVPSGSRSICSSPAKLPTPGQQQPEAEVRIKLCFCRGQGQSTSTVAPLIWMLTYLLQVTFVISHGMQTSDNTGRERGALRLRRKCIFPTSHQPNYQLLSFAKSFSYAYSSKSESI